jgi:hypothetical protein
MAKWRLNVLVKTTSPTAKLKGLSQGYGYGDEGILADESGAEVWRGPVRAWPNPFEPGVGTPWQQVYACVAPGSWPFHYYVSTKNGPSLMLNGGNKITTRYPNPAQNHALFAKAVAVHAGGKGKNPNWPGSRACITVDPAYATAFFQFFHQGDIGTIEIVDVVEPAAAPQHTNDRLMASQVFAKPPLSSKTIWANAVAVASGMAARYLGVEVDSTLMVLLLAAVNILLRFVTKRPIVPDKELESWVVDLMLNSHDIDIDGMLKARKRGRRVAQTTRGPATK